MAGAVVHATLSAYSLSFPYNLRHLGPHRTAHRPPQRTSWGTSPPAPGGQLPLRIPCRMLSPWPELYFWSFCCHSIVAQPLQAPRCVLQSHSSHNHEDAAPAPQVREHHVSAAWSAAHLLCGPCLDEAVGDRPLGFLVDAAWRNARPCPLTPSRTPCRFTSRRSAREPLRICS